MEAELARIADNGNLAMEMYEKAIELAHENGFIHWEAVAHELAGNYFQSKKSKTAADAHYIQALSLYQVIINITIRIRII